MGGRGASSGGGAGVGGSGSHADIQILAAGDLTSKRNEGRQIEVDSVLEVLRNVNDEYGYILNDSIVAKLGGKDGARVLAFYEEGGVIGVNQKFFNQASIEAAYDAAGDYHPPRGAKNGMEAVIAHEAGHALTDAVAAKLNLSHDAAARRIVGEAWKAKNQTVAQQMAKNISGYATESNSECIAEAFCDVYCNGNNATQESKRIVKIIDKYLK